jgi:hypothetical protein
MHKRANMLIFQIYVQKGQFNKRKFKFDHVLVFIFSSPNKKSLKTYYYNSSRHGAFVFFLLEHLFCLSQCKTRWTMSMDNAGLEICLLGTSIAMVTLT